MPPHLNVSCLRKSTEFKKNEKKANLVSPARPDQAAYAQRNLFEILLIQSEIRLYLSCTDSFGTANGHCPFAVPNKSVNGK